MFMLEKALTGGWKYRIWALVLLVVAGIGFRSYLHQLHVGLGITGLSRDVTWGLYIAQFTFLVGVAASAVMVVLPYYMHDFKEFAGITILGEFLAIASVAMCVLFILADMGQPARVLNVLRHAAPGSMMFWDMAALGGYLVLNVVITVVTLSAERMETPPPSWIRPVILISIPWAITIHTVTAFLYNGLQGRPFWFTAILAPRFLASAFASGPALLILLCLAMRRLTRFDAGREPVQKLAIIVTYSMIANAFFLLLEVFTVWYGGIPEHTDHFRYLFFGLEGRSSLVPWMWVSVTLSAASLVSLVVPRWRRNETVLAPACVLVFVSLWIEKGIGLIVGGFVPSSLGAVTEYAPTLPETAISLGVWAIGLLMVTVFYKITLSVRESAAP
jgi:molybdopterin-containing oxidoreductase family membrane subunit